MVKITEHVSVFLNNKLNSIVYLHGKDTFNRYTGFYGNVPSPLKEIFSFFHSELNQLFSHLNVRLSTGHYTAQESRNLIGYINAINKFQVDLSTTEVAFNLCTYYKRTINECQEFLKPSGGSPIPADFKSVNIIEMGPIFELQTGISVTRSGASIPFRLKTIGEGSYATVHKYKDTFYNQFFAVKKARKNLNETEYNRFRTEFLEMRKLKSPYILEVYKFDDENRQYIMEYANDSLHSYILKNNNSMTFSQRNSLIQQIFKAFIYLHEKDILHRDISPTNILVKTYEDTEIIKVSDFGLVKLEDSQLTNQYTELKGVFNDPLLAEVGFSNYKKHHEIYALTRLIYFIITAKMQISTYPNTHFQGFVAKGINRNIEERYKSVQEMRESFSQIVSTVRYFSKQ
ncbi:protein kinase family protein [Bacillus thuringiensis]|uniref:protein kinase family protein n=1 Tax=Bacillus thuringiensis TaxID=1428 RepID=UPI000BF69351|nr:protein kinase family protein [Bacillus thuringiensis]PEW27349.1 serine/threonine protein kinase [Bacillus thuringiensis]